MLLDIVVDSVAKVIAEGGKVGFITSQTPVNAKRDPLIYKSKLEHPPSICVMNVVGKMHFLAGALEAEPATIGIADSLAAPSIRNSQHTSGQVEAIRASVWGDDSAHVQIRYANESPLRQEDSFTCGIWALFNVYHYTLKGNKQVLYILRILLINIL